LTDFKFLSY